MKPQSPFAPQTIGEHARAPLTPPPTTPTAGVSWWRRFRNLPPLGQIGIWIGIALVGLVALALAVGPTTKKDAGPASSATSAPAKATPAPTRTAVADATTTTLQSREAAIGAGNVASCRNGGYSNNTDFSSTCSSSGDVKEWLAPYGECQDGTVIKMSADASCDNHGGFKILMPVDFTPPTTTVAATIPTTVPPTAPPTAPPPTLPNFGGGTKLVGIDIQPGTYVTSSIDGFSCSWERLSDVSGDFSAIIANSNLLPGAQGLVEIKPSDVAFKSSGCGT